MPIRPSERARYPADWNQIRTAILERAGNRCECEGECGLHCTTPGPRRCREEHGFGALFARGRVVLTIAHLDHTPENNEPANLKAMCQRCHLRYDAVHHAQNASRTRDAKRGQQRLFGQGTGGH